MSWNTTPEQDAVINWSGSQLVVNAFAGTGKTSTLVKFAENNPNSRILYLAYNRAIRDEAELKFPFNVECKTSHQLAWPSFGKHYKKRLTGNLRLTDIARKLNTRHWPTARVVLTTLNAFLCSADPELNKNHLPDEDERCGLSELRVLGATSMIWEEMRNTDSTFPVTHDAYLKMFQLSEPQLSERFDTILFDEAQDANPVTSAFVLNQKCRVILVGDRYQQIYRFRGANNALSTPELSQADRLWLTTSFRFGSEVADVANALLSMAGESKKVTGKGTVDHVVCEIPDKSSHYTVLSRTVSGVISSALKASNDGENVYWVGGIEGYKVEEFEDLYWFSTDMPERMQSPRLSRDFHDYEEFCSVAKSTQDVEMNQAIRLLDDFFPLPQKLAIMRSQVVTSEKKATVTVSTAHRSKGLEWPVVVLNEDFSDISDPLLSETERQDEINLLYVASTRAKSTLVLNEQLWELSGKNIAPKDAEIEEEYQDKSED